MTLYRVNFVIFETSMSIDFEEKIEHESKGLGYKFLQTLSVP